MSDHDHEPCAAGAKDVLVCLKQQERLARHSDEARAQELIDCCLKLATTHTLIKPYAPKVALRYFDFGDSVSRSSAQSGVPSLSAQSIATEAYQIYIERKERKE